MQRRDVIVIGSSLGGVEALSALVGQLPSSLAAALLVVQHTSPSSPGLLAEILAARGPLPAVTAEDGMEARQGRIHIAPPNRHLLLTERGLRVVFGPRENRARPAIDPLFRTAAVHYRSRVIGVVLTGLLGDGGAGLSAVERCGGVPVVQCPEDAAYPEMPSSALRVVERAVRAPLEELGPLLVRLTAEPAPEAPPVPDALRIEARLTERAMENEDWGTVPSLPVDFSCPDCGGALREIDEEGMRRYRCRVGHAFSSDDLLGAKGETVEAALWMAVQTLEERAQMLEALSRDERRKDRPRSASSFEASAGEAREHAERLRDLLAKLMD